MKKKIGILIGITALVFLISIVLYVVLKENCIGRSIDILLYASQAILAGFITFIGLLITITDQEAQRTANQKIEKLKEICPCFYATLVRIFGPNHFESSAISLVSKDESNKKMVECKFINSRNNVALNVALVNPFDQSTYLFNIEEKQKLILCTKGSNNYLKLQYTDIYGNNYNQKISYFFNNTGKVIFTVDQPMEGTNEENK